MDDELNPAPTAEISGNDKAAADKANGQSNPQPAQKPKPRNRQTSKWLGLTKSKWREIAGFIVLIPWIYNDLSDSHNFAKLFLLVLSLVIAQGVVCSFLKSRQNALILWFVSLMPLAVVVYENTQPPIAKHLNLELHAIDSVIFDFPLTNNLILKSSSPTNGPIATRIGDIIGCLVIPTEDGQSNCSLYFGLRNPDPQSDAKDVEIVLTISKNLIFTIASFPNTVIFPDETGPFASPKFNDNPVPLSVLSILDETPLRPLDHWGFKLNCQDILTRKPGEPTFLGIEVKADTMPNVGRQFAIMFLNKHSNAFKYVATKSKNDTSGNMPFFININDFR